MEHIQSFRLNPLKDPVARSHLLARDESVAQVEGAVLEGQYQCALGYLIVTSDGNPHEEMLHFYLFSEAFRLIDEVSVGRIYHSGIFRELFVGRDDVLEFSFFGTERWRLSILTRPRRELFPKPFSAIRRAHGWFRPHHLDLAPA